MAKTRHCNYCTALVRTPCPHPAGYFVRRKGAATGSGETVAGVTGLCDGSGRNRGAA